MAILIDPPIWPAHGTTFAHLVSDTSLAELHDFAERAGLSDRAFDTDHYDVPAHRYEDLIALGARPISGRELIRRLRASGLRVPARDRPEALRSVLTASWHSTVHRWQNEPDDDVPRPTASGRAPRGGAQAGLRPAASSRVPQGPASPGTAASPPLPQEPASPGTAGSPRVPQEPAFPGTAGSPPLPQEPASPGTAGSPRVPHEPASPGAAGSPRVPQEPAFPGTAAALDDEAARALGAELIDRWAQPHRRYHDLRHLRDVLAALDLLCEPDPPPLPVVLAAWFHDAVYDGEPGADEQASADLARSRLSTLEAGPAAPSTGVGRTAPATGHTAASTDRTGADTSQAPSNCDRNPPSAGPTAPSTDAPATGTDAPTAGTDDHAGTGARPAAQQDHLSSEVARLVLLTATHSPEPGDHHGALLCDADLAVLARDPAGYRRYTADVRAEYAHVPEADFIKGRAAVVGHLLDLDPLYRTARGRELWQDRARANLRAELDALTQP